MIALLPLPDLRDMGGPAADLDLEPHDADIGAHQAVMGRLGDQRGVRVIAAHQARQRAVAGAFLFGDRLEVDMGRRLHARPFQRVKGEQIGRQAGLHVAGSAAVHPAVLDGGLIGREAPHVDRAGRHHVDMPVQDQRPADRLARTVGAHHIDRVVIVDADRRKAWMVLDLVDVDRPTVHGQPALFHGVVHEILGGVLLAALGGKAYELLQKRDLVVEQIVDRLGDGVGKGGISHGSSGSDRAGGAGHYSVPVWDPHKALDGM